MALGFSITIGTGYRLTLGPITTPDVGIGLVSTPDVEAVIC